MFCLISRQHLCMYAVKRGGLLELRHTPTIYFTIWICRVVTAENMLNKYGNFALSFSYFIPVVRHIIPYLVGMNKMPYRTFVLYS
ncbi:DedA family protein [Paenibacillus alba]|uniref:DedA family protein n=1 Tax=Paenibacillus alba TaxID=1197127 RepID=UPI003B846011